MTAFGRDAKNKPVTQYFVHPFTLTNKKIVDELALHLLVDDGAIVYLNGVEVARYHLPKVVDALTLATGAFIESAWIKTAIDKTLLRQGENLLGVEVHQISAHSSDLSFDLALAYQPSRHVNAMVPEVVPEQELKAGKSVAISTNNAKVFSTLYKIKLPAGVPILTLSATGGSGDADLYLCKDKPPTLTEWHARSAQTGDEQVVLKAPEAGVYYVALYSYRPFADVTLLATW